MIRAPSQVDNCCDDDVSNFHFRMNNGKVAAIETDRLRKLEKTNGW